MTTAVDELATVASVHAYLQHHPTFAAHTVERLSGGFGNFTYRIHLLAALAGRRTLVLKYAPPYAAASGGRFPLDQKRQRIEVEALRLAARLSAADVPAFVAVPAVHLFDEARHVVIMDDAGEGTRTLKQVLIEEGLPEPVSEQIGAALGGFVAGVHAWREHPDADLSAFAHNEAGKHVAGLVTYGRLESTLSGRDGLAALSGPSLGVPEAKMATIAKLAEKRQRAIHAASASDPVMHGDFWPGNLVMSLRRGPDGTVEGVERVYVLDWELCRTGLPGLELGQLCAELFVLSEFYPSRAESTRAMIGSFLGAYRERRGGGEDVELARTAVSHMGAHMVAWTPRVSTWSGREKTREVVERGVEMLVLGEEGSESSLKTSIVAPLLV